MLNVELSLKARLQLTNNKDFMRVGGAIFAYLFNRISQRELLSSLGDKELADRVLEIVRSSGYVLKNCKLYAFAVWKARESSLPVPRTREFLVHKEDGPLLRRINLAHVQTHYVAMTLEDMDAMLEGATSSPLMLAHIGKYISKKLIFLSRNYGVPREDIEGDLKRAAVAAVYKTYPMFESPLHLTNVAKAAIHNTGMSLITHHTRQKRQRLYKDEEGLHQAVTENIESHLDIAAEPEYLSHAREHLQTLVSLQHRMSDEVQSFLLAAAGHYHAGLSEFLKQDNSDLVDKLKYDSYLKQVRSYFGVTEAQTDRLFNKLRRNMA